MNRNTRTALIIGGIIVAFLIVAPFIWDGVSRWHGSWGDGMMGGFGWGSMSIVMILFWVLVIWGIVALVRGLGTSDSHQLPSTREESALDVLKKRYARGEINKEEYEEKKRDII